MLASLALLASLAQEPATTAVRIDVVVRDAAGRAVETLKPADFELREDGTAQALTDVQLVHGSARLIGVYLDEYYVSASKTAAVKAALHRFIDALDAADRVVILRTLDSLLARDGRLVDELREGRVPPTEEELAGWSELPPGADELADQGARPADTRAADEFYLRTFAEPTLEINGIETGSPQSAQLCCSLLSRPLPTSRYRIRAAPIGGTVCLSTARTS